jgi:hypothetical protein
MVSCLMSDGDFFTLYSYQMFSIDYLTRTIQMKTQTSTLQQPTMVTMSTTRSSNIAHAFVVPLSIVLLLTTTVSLLTIGARAFSASSASSQTFQNAETALKMEAVVRRYFDGVNNKDPVQIRSCFSEIATIRDVSTSGAVTNGHLISTDIIQSSTGMVQITAAVSALIERHMEFGTAHPDAKVEFSYGPEKGRTSPWVVAHWFQTGTWSGDSGGIPAPAAGANRQPMAVEGQTRFLVDREALKITAMVVTRTFTEWEKLLLENRQADAELTSKTARNKLF